MSRAFKTSCRCATTANITLAGLQTVDTIALAEGDLVLVKNQSLAAENGIWVAKAGSWDRASGFNSFEAIRHGCFVMALEPVVAVYVLATPPPISLGITELEFAAIGDSSGGGGGGGDGEFDPSDAPAMARTAYVGTNPLPELDDVDETGSPIAAFTTIAEALTKFTGYTGGLVTILVDDSNYTENLGIDIQDKSIAIRALSGRRLRLSGTHSVTVANGGHRLYVDGVGDATHANTFTGFDGGVPASSAPVVFVFKDCENFSVGMNGGAASLVNVEADGVVLPASGSISVLGTSVRLRNVRSFGGGFTVTFGGAFGTLDMDATTADLWAGGTAKTLTNGTHYSSGRFTYSGPDASGNTTHDSFNVDTLRAATVGIQAQRSPVGWWGSRGWDTDDSVSRLARMGFQCRPIAGATVSAVLAILFGLDGVVSDTGLSIHSAGRLYFGGLAPAAAIDGKINFGYDQGIVCVRQDGTNADHQFILTTVGGVHNWLALGSSNTNTRLSSTIIQVGAAVKGRFYFGPGINTTSADGMLNVLHGTTVLVGVSQDGASFPTLLAWDAISGDNNWFTVGNSSFKTRIGSSNIRIGSVTPSTTPITMRFPGVTNGAGALIEQTASALIFRGDTKNAGTNQDGLPTYVEGGGPTGTGRMGSAALRLNPDDVEANGQFMCEAAEVVDGRRVLALCGITAADTTKLPTNTGDGILHIGRAQTAPTAAPGSGCLMWVDPSNDHLMVWRAGGGAAVDLTP